VQVIDGRVRVGVAGLLGVLILLGAMVPFFQS